MVPVLAEELQLPIQEAVPMLHQACSLGKVQYVRRPLDSRVSPSSFIVKWLQQSCYDVAVHTVGQAFSKTPKSGSCLRF